MCSSYCILKCVHLYFVFSFKLRNILAKKSKENVTAVVSPIKMMMMMFQYQPLFPLNIPCCCSGMVPARWCPSGVKGASPRAMGHCCPSQPPEPPLPWAVPGECWKGALALLGVINEMADFCSYCQNFWALGQPWDVQQIQLCRVWVWWRWAMLREWAKQLNPT